MYKKPELLIKLDKRSLYLRSLVVECLFGGGRGHMGSAMSIIEILRVLYDDFLKYRPGNPSWDERDLFILSKGHGFLALLSALYFKGLISREEIFIYLFFTTRIFPYFKLHFALLTLTLIIRKILLLTFIFGSNQNVL